MACTMITPSNSETRAIRVNNKYRSAPSGSFCKHQELQQRTVCLSFITFFTDPNLRPNNGGFKNTFQRNKFRETEKFWFCS